MHSLFRTSPRGFWLGWQMCFISNWCCYLWLGHLHPFHKTWLCRLLCFPNNRRRTLHLGLFSRPGWRHRPAYLAFSPDHPQFVGSLQPGAPHSVPGHLEPFVPWNEQHTSDVLRTKIIYIEEFFDTYLALDLFFRGGLAKQHPTKRSTKLQA